MTVVDEGGFSAAARALYRSQGRVSGHIHELERALGVRLFDRSARPVVLTPPGQAFLEYARSIASYVEAGKAAAAAMRGLDRGQVTLGTFPSAGELFIAPLLASFRRRFPGVTVELVEEAVRGLDDALLHGDLAIAIRPWLPTIPSVGVQSTRLWREAVKVIAPLDHPLGRSSTPLQLEELHGQPMVISGRHLHQTAWAFQLLTSHGVEPQVTAVSDQLQILVGMVAAGFGIGLTNHLALRTLRTDHLRVRDLQPPLYREVGVFWKEAVISTETAASALLHEVLHMAVPPETADLRDRTLVGQLATTLSANVS